MVFDAPDGGLAAARGPSTPPRLCAIVVNHRRPDLLADALRALYSSRRRPDDIVVVEAEATEAPSLPPDEHDPPLPVRVVLLPDNPGYAAACNRGAAGTYGAWLLFMNADVMVDADCLGLVLSSATADPAIGIATCRLLRPDGSLDHACHRGIPSVLDSLAYRARLDRLFPRSRRFGHYRLSWLDPTGSHDIEACSGAFLLIRREALEAVGGWDERYWFYAEDLDLCLRVARAGWRVRYVGSATAVHVKGASSRLRQRPEGLTPEQRVTRQRVREAAIDSHELFYREHLEPGTNWFLRPLVRAQFALQRLRTGHRA